MALMDFPRGRSKLRSQPLRPINRTTTQGYQRKWPRTAIEVARTFLVLVGMAIGVLTLRFALVLTHGMPH